VYRVRQKNLTVFKAKEHNDVSPYYVTVTVIEEVSTCHFMFCKVSPSDVPYHFSNTAPFSLEDFPSPDESSAPGLLRVRRWF
jgi:hypothetical protein